ncbi:MAG TPA: TMEM165/GDT1 family protein [Noviherbaspirillum sp.]|jgi:putative Ca2+/H+ antiporter (TMEM165/GDT1 family)|uniref:TMEM165/GDT1 family protein n=1 Tax=Noviherbaspirillum sp. TaxID=1926288 RepID=UPI002DDD8AAB|nr:TMEM165/GDT1 family protein [Noviherbaspirillum sp.]HEV2610678.1 TMEM165/GDT1 family protein [Noviherbaspirillum sp.]
MEAFLISTFAVAVAEIGDKTQLLALILAARYKRPIPIIFGILAATLLNHALAGLLGEWIRTMIDPGMLRWILGASFLVIAAWALIPDKMEEGGQTQGRYGVFFVTCIAFFIAEIGDKTQIATVALAAKYSSFLPVVAGTTIGMMIANVPAVILGKIASPNFPFKLVRTISAGIFAVLGVAVLLSGS